MCTRSTQELHNTVLQMETISCSWLDEMKEIAVALTGIEFDLMDVDKDAQISRDEYTAIYGAESGADFDRADTNKDGSLTKAEFRAGLSQQKQTEAALTDVTKQLLSLESSDLSDRVTRKTLKLIRHMHSLSSKIATEYPVYLCNKLSTLVPSP